MATACHIVLTLHGLDGFDSDLVFIKQNLQKRYQNLIFVNATTNHNKTYDGILAGGKRILQEFEDLVESKNIQSCLLSVIGHSLGGLYGRCFLGLLFQKGLIPSKFTPICYISLVTPHLGSREHGKLLGNAITGMVLSTAIGTTGAELMLYDDQGGKKVPFLVELSTDYWTDCLRLFKRLVVYSNTRYDVSVHYSTAAIRAPSSTFTPPQKIQVYPAILADSTPEPEPLGMDYESVILRNLIKLDWKRYAVIPSRPFLAHIDIIVKSVWLNHRYGIAIVSHIIDHFRSLHLPTSPQVHLIVLITEQSSRDLLPLIESIRDQYPRPFYKVITLDWGTKIYDDLVYQLDHSNATKLSFIGHGVGGLISRWLVGLLERRDIQFVNMICIDTPNISIGLPQTTFWNGKDISSKGNDSRMVDLINSEAYISSLSRFSNLVLYASTKDPSLSLESGLLLDEPDSFSEVSGPSIVSLDCISSGIGVKGLPWKRFAIVQTKSVKLSFYWNDADHPIHEHITSTIVG